MKEAEAQDREGGAELSKCSPGNRQVGILRAQVSVPVDATVLGGAVLGLEEDGTRREAATTL